MISFSEFRKLSNHGNLIPLYFPIPADLDTPVSAFLKISKSEASFLLESVAEQERWGRYSFLAAAPKASLEAFGNRWQLTDLKGTKKTTEKGQGNPLTVLEERLKEYHFVPNPDFPRLSGGAVGFLGYDTVRFFEELPDRKLTGPAFPDLNFGIYDELMLFDNLMHRAYWVKNVSLNSKDSLQKIYETEVVQTQKKIAQFHKTPLPKLKKHTGTAPTFKANMSLKTYRRALLQAKEYIRAGDIFQIVLSDRWTASGKVDPIEVYRALRRLNPSPYLFCLKMGKNSLVGASPEMLVRLENGKVSLRPIAGTRWRGKTTEEDQKLAAEMLADPKERAEHLMLVDLGRNDVGRVANAGSVNVSEFMTVERYSHVMHLVSNIEGQLQSGKTAFDLLKATFPAGTLTGAPKIRAMEIIEELEIGKRGPYGGSVGYIDFAGNMDMAITIRSVAMNGKELWVQSGGGIVEDSQVEAEYLERQNKAKAVMEAVKMACA